MQTNERIIDEKRERLSSEKKAYMQTVEWVLTADKNLSDKAKEAVLLVAIEELLAAEEADAEKIFGMDATAYGRQLTKTRIPETTHKNPIPLFVFIGIVAMSLFLVVMGILHFVNKDHVFYMGTFFVSLVLVFICIVCVLAGGYILWKHYTVTVSKSIAAYFLIGSGIVIMYIFVLVFILMILPNFGAVISSGALIEMILGVAGFITASIVWRKI
ncbi:DUF1129 family protein [Listeria grandensis]|uniref:DUF1129 family protein n=1 Tax=Listeria grandensis TaxID=1494963 RepID=UPI00164ED29C|nr:DUF1129 family protein [Listeria grandensis]MBC6315113.1 DUF1129 family protein [Listeria grandensis]